MFPLFVGGMEWIIILVVVAILIFFGAKKIPQFARGLGKATAEFRRGKIEIERAIKEEQEQYDEKKKDKKGTKSKKLTEEYKKVKRIAEELNIEPVFGAGQINAPRTDQQRVGLLASVLRREAQP